MIKTGTDTNGPPHVVVVGGGFAGLNAARAMRRDPVRITLIDRENYHLFQPLLYQVATAVLNPSDIAQPLRSIFRKQRNATVLLAEATDIDPAGKRVILDNGSVSYDFLIVATGASHTYFGNPEWSEIAPGLKSVEDSLEIRRRVLLAYEAAERESDPQKRDAWLRFVVVGAGPTGVELAGALSEIGRQTLARDFRRIDPTRVEVLLLEGQDRVLPVYVPSLSAKAQEQLEDLGVQVRTSCMVTGMDESCIELDSGERISTRTVLWAAGVQASPLASALDAPTDRSGRVQVEPDLSVPGHPELFVAGDLAAVEDVPGVAPAAMQQGKYIARVIRNRLAGKTVEPFEYNDKGSMATIGRAAAVADVGPVKLSGLLAWLGWLLVHILFLVGFRNRVWVLLGWAWSYLSFKRGARLITGRAKHGVLPKLEGEMQEQESTSK